MRADEFFGIFLYTRACHLSYVDDFHLHFYLKSQVEPLVQCWTEIKRVDILVLEQSIWSFTTKYDICCGIFIDAFYQDKKVTLNLLFVKCFYHKGVMHFYIYSNDHVFFFFFLNDMVCYINWFFRCQTTVALLR